MVRRVKMVNMRHGARFRDDRSNRCWDMSIFRFFKTAAVLRMFRPPTKSTW